MDIKKYLNFIKVEHTLFSLPLIYAGVFLASENFPSIRLLVLVLVAAIFARISAMTANRIIDAEIDRRNPRTKMREIPSGKISHLKAIIILIISLLGYFVTAFLISEFCFYLSPIPIIIFIIYPYMKRFTHFAHFGVGLGLSMGPLGGWFAVKNSFENILPGALLSLFTLFWATSFDIIYSTLDEEFDRANNLNSFPVKFGKKKALLYSILLHIISYVFLVILFFYYTRNVISLIFLLSVGILYYFEHKYAEKDVELSFFKLNAVVSFVVFLMIITRGI
ncbi:MAG: putative 4-hydroxybenzoate polyprenyltransferase [Ignavibacteria bacterium]|nr:putative 4-hydroxybenzoate polyprenyltransferase [Ignavibacteria bacterium]